MARKKRSQMAPSSISNPSLTDQHNADDILQSLSDLQITDSSRQMPKKVRRKTVVKAFDDYFGDSSQLTNWQRLCIDLGMEDVPESTKKCKKALSKVWVNIYDFLDAKAMDTQVKLWKSERALAQYTISTGKVYPKKKAKEGGPARALLAHIFRS